MDEDLEEIAQQVAVVKNGLDARDQAIARARSNGKTWRAIAAAAGMTELGCRKIVERVVAKG